MKRNEVLDNSVVFSVELFSFGKTLWKYHQRELRSQLICSGTSIGANVAEAQGAESKRDFYHKMSVAFKEAMETEYWLQVCARSNELPDPGNLLERAQSL
jgi:four helix bundle protein